MALDTLEIFGDEYTGVAGFKATDDNGNTKTYIRPQGTITLNSNGSGIDVSAYADATVLVSPSLEAKTKTYTPTESQQTETISPSTGYDGISSVGITVGAISPTYVGSGVTQRTSSDLSASTLTVTAPAGYYASSASTTLTDANLLATNIKKNTTIFGVTGSYEGAGWTKIGSTTELAVNTTSTSASSAGTIALGSTYYTKDYIIYVRVRDKSGKQNGYFYGTDTYFMNFYKANGATTTLSTVAQICYRYNNSALAATAGGYGVYGYSINSSGTLTIRKRYNSSYSLTVNSTYLIDVYYIAPPLTLFG